MVEDAHPAGVFPVPDEPLPTAEVLDDAERLRTTLGVRLPAPFLTEVIAAWAQLFGLVSFELFGQFNRVVDARDAFFDRAVVRLAQGVGLSADEAAG